MLKLSSPWWWDLSTREFSELDMANIVAVLPVGAVEQHGPHLPVRVDAAINAGIIQRAVELLPDDLPMLILPALPVGKSDEHLAYPGTLSLPYDVLGKVWFEVAKSAWRAGIRKLIFWNSHGGQPQLMEIVCRQLRIELGMFAVSASWFRTIDASDLYSAHELQHGIHGGESETSMMLHLHPELVQMAHADNFVSTSVGLEAAGGILTPEGGIGFGWMAQDLHLSGTTGNAAAADAERGAIATDRAARSLLKLAREVQTFNTDFLTANTAFNQK
ncbi:TPA: creatininase family protein [Klebsiella pneumoniae]|uniref:creatininase family protein n=1 Tax=Klebsiella pneumoniae TaxID=573 RepID=UPI00217E70B1|nr:creatininase family protein [Klebsiella pneumoniae]MCS6007800.1 creatininase family protein [Klebsiella pneumoniae subsp. pneumoniae]HBW3372364.1 creatininase family protein [Klebsiella pneumoniae]HBW7250422.1 creatininase family protein [Klebsiella pneumoniae]HBW8261907.1 creatininase family protein [Klebsiella pneumoniae]HBW8267443.1 creatininase family protein [Klebsiella pneumoniae]